MRREYPQAPLVGVGAVVIEGGRVLLVRRRGPPLKGEWSLPGGALEIGETLKDAVIREVQEETGLSVRPRAIVEVLELIDRDPDGPESKAAGRIRYHYVLIDFLCEAEGGALQAGADAEDARWVERDRLSQGDPKLPEFTMAVIDKAFRMLGRRAKGLAIQDE